MLVPASRKVSRILLNCFQIIGSNVALILNWNSLSLGCSGYKIFLVQPREIALLSQVLSNAMRMTKKKYISFMQWNFDHCSSLLTVSFMSMSGSYILHYTGDKDASKRRQMYKQTNKWKVKHRMYQMVICEKYEIGKWVWNSMVEEDYILM